MLLNRLLNDLNCTIETFNELHREKCTSSLRSGRIQVFYSNCLESRKSFTIFPLTCKHFQAFFSPEFPPVFIERIFATCFCETKSAFFSHSELIVITYQLGSIENLYFYSICCSNQRRTLLINASMILILLHPSFFLSAVRMLPKIAHQYHQQLLAATNHKPFIIGASQEDYFSCTKTRYVWSWFSQRQVPIVLLSRCISVTIKV